jgi:tetratricopeptide (TPR) repeat protein
MDQDIGRMPMPWFRMRTRILLNVCYLLIGGSIAFGQAPGEFAKGNQEFGAGHFKEAIDAYEELVRSGTLSANLFYDLGNAYFRAGDFGRSILNYERAIALDPHHPEAQANLRIARDEARALELAPGGIQRFVQFATPKQYAISAAVAFWIGAFCVIIAIFARRKRSGLVALSILSFAACVFSALSAFWVENGNHGRDLAIVTGDNVEARLATADSARTVLALPRGSEIRILSERGDWIYAALPNDLRGWIPGKSAEPVRL